MVIHDNFSRQKIADKFFCKKCLYTCSKESDFKKHLLTIQHCYSKYKYFNEINNNINEIINRKYKYLSELNIDLILYIIEYLEIDIEINLFFIRLLYSKMSYNPCFLKVIKI